MRPIHGLSLLVLLSLGLSGCLQQDPNAGSDHEAAWTSGSDFGVEMERPELHDDIVSGSQKVWAFQVVNVGPDGGNKVEYNAACAGPFTVTLTAPDGTRRQPSEPKASCEAIDMENLVGGQRIDFPWAWDGKVWERGGSLTPTSGVYTIRVTFTGFHDGNEAHVTDVWGETTVYVEGG